MGQNNVWRLLVPSVDPEAILFDEPTSALDPEMVGEVLQDHAGAIWNRVDHDYRYP